ncbi:endonuclease/exonuclease/phosphatase family protein [Stutzerimonas azotifigens]|uniref:endonuclease/exonuclease/phosphatase family protein n=1 Tax=Stutzerimonas azotifigens TaxID=291995 RepID=UPI0003FEEA9F|nr:endonuclease/exonuclease/phosphatase family protein [Stutzerimonas azotifigens]
MRGAWLLGGGLVALAVLAGLPWAAAWRPAAREAAPVSCNADTPQLLAGQALKVMTWNIQFLSGRQPVPRPDRPAPADPVELDATRLAQHLDRVATVIRAEAPDILLLQELHDGAAATDRQDQLALLRARLADLYPCSGEAFYRKAAFVPGEPAFGGVGLKLGILSRFQLADGQRLQLPAAEAPFWRAPFALRPALLSVRLPMRPGGSLTVATTQLDTQDAAVARRQALMLSEQIAGWRAEDRHWLLGGDLGLADGLRAPSSAGVQRIPDSQDVQDTGAEAWLTYGERTPDAIRDLLWLDGSLKRVEARVRHQGAETVSEHLPVIVRLLLPPPE